MSKKRGITLTFVAFALIATMNTCSDMRVEREKNNPANDIKRIAQEFQNQDIIIPADSNEAIVNKIIDDLANQNTEESETIKQK